MAVCWNPGGVNPSADPNQAATFGWLCVETILARLSNNEFVSSHLRVAVCWNTPVITGAGKAAGGSHLRVAVCWNRATSHWKDENHVGSHLRVAVCWNEYNRSWCITSWSAATFGWLCVETTAWRSISIVSFAATFGWLCVETVLVKVGFKIALAATFGWLCVET